MRRFDSDPRLHLLPRVWHGVAQVSRAGGWPTELTGHNLAPLYAALEDHSLARLRSQPTSHVSAEHEMDTFATSIRFFGAPNTSIRQGQGELDLGLV